MTKTTTATQARRNLFSLIRYAGKPGNRVRITLRGEKQVMLMSANEFDEWVERIAKRNS